MMDLIFNCEKSVKDLFESDLELFKSRFPESPLRLDTIINVCPEEEFNSEYKALAEKHGGINGYDNYFNSGFYFDNSVYIRENSDVSKLLKDFRHEYLGHARIGLINHEYLDDIMVDLGDVEVFFTGTLEDSDFSKLEEISFFRKKMVNEAFATAISVYELVQYGGIPVNVLNVSYPHFVINVFKFLINESSYLLCRVKEKELFDYSFLSYLRQVLLFAHKSVPEIEDEISKLEFT